MHPIRFVRLNVLGMTQSEFARALGVREAAVSKWETGRVLDLPIVSKIRPTILEIVAERGLPWNDAWLFELPVCDACIGLDNCASGCRRISDRCMGHDLHDGVLPPAHNGNHAAEIPQEPHEALP